MGNLGELKKSYYEQIHAEFGPGWRPIGIDAEKARVERLKEKAVRFSNNVAFIQKAYDANHSNHNEKELEKSLDEFDKARDEYERAKEMLDTGEVFGTQAPIENTNYIACDSEISLADLYDIRHKTNGKAPRIVAERYDDTAVASTTAEGAQASEIEFADCVNTFTADFESMTKLDSIEVIPEFYLADDPELSAVAINNLRFKHLRSAENALLCNMITNSKDAEDLESASDLLTVPTLSAKAQRGAEIITNETGFGKLDIRYGAEPEPLIKKNFAIGEFVFAERYIIRVLPDEILPNNQDESSPVLLGDWKNILRLAIVDERAAEFQDIVAFTIKTRTIRREVPILTTTSDKAYFVGALA